MNPLDRFTHAKEYVRVTRRRPSQSPLAGYVLDTSDYLALMHIFNDFTPDGYTILRLDDVEEVRSSHIERHWHRMLSGEGLLSGLKLGFKPDLSSMPSAIESLWRQYRHIIIECEDEDDPIEDFYIGFPLVVGRGGVIFRYFDACGLWREMPELINASEITRVQFDTPYINHFEKYLGDGEPA